MGKKPTLVKKMHEKTLIYCVYAPHHHTIVNADYYYDEFLSLIKTLEEPCDEKVLVKLRHVDKNNFLTKGKLQDLKALCRDKGIERIFFSAMLSPLQERNLEDATECRIYDREKIILEIFKKSAKTAEGKTQVEMAEIQFLKTRLIGKGKEFAQQAGFIGGRGPGETFKEEARRHFAERDRQAKKRLITLQRSRDVQRKRRLASNIFLSCLIGYTNAGKSSLMNRLTRSEVHAEDKLFATLDTTTRELYLGPEKTILISDTVGFISQLPHTLIEAFKSTLDELFYADLLLHVIDISNPSWEEQVDVVEQTLEDLGVAHKPILYVFNKVDVLTPQERVTLSKSIFPYHPQVLTHAVSKEGVAMLLSALRNYKFKEREHAHESSS